MSLERKTTLICGGAGYVGSHTVLAMLDAGRKCVILDDLSTGTVDLIPDGVPFVEGNIIDSNLVADTMRRYNVGSILHFAGSSLVSESVEHPLAYYENNASASLSLIKNAIAHNISALVFSSSAAVYGDVENVPVNESAPLRPITPYGRSKLMTEWMLEDACAAHNLSFVALRYFNVAGADMNGRSGQINKKSTHLIKIACETALGIRPEMTIFGDDYDTPDGSCIRDFIHVTDLADVHLAAIDYLLAGGDSSIFNCGNGRGYSVKEVVSTVEILSGHTFSYHIGPRRPGDIKAVVADPSQAKVRLNWAPRFTELKDMITSTLAWERHRTGSIIPLTANGNS